MQGSGIKSTTQCLEPTLCFPTCQFVHVSFPHLDKLKSVEHCVWCCQQMPSSDLNITYYEIILSRAEKSLGPGLRLIDVNSGLQLKVAHETLLTSGESTYWPKAIHLLWTHTHGSIATFYIAMARISFRLANVNSKSLSS